MLNNKPFMMVALLTGATILFSCGGDDKEEDKNSGTPSQSSSGSLQGSGVSGDNVNANTITGDPSVCGYEVPHIDPHYDYICHRLQNGDVNFVLEYNPEQMHSRWVAYTYTTKNAQRNSPTRTDAWNPDPYYDNMRQFQLATGTFPGYTRGHLVGSAERYFSTEANEQTFYMTNMSPQLYAFNGDYWGEIEDKARDNWGRGVIDQRSTFYEGVLYITKGGTIDRPENIIEHITVRNTNGGNVRMAVPRFFFMACLFISKEGNAQAIGFWMEHKDYNLNTQDKSAMRQLRRSTVRSIDELEQLTGIDFFCNLTDAVEQVVESTYDISLWPGI